MCALLPAWPPTHPAGHLDLENGFDDFRLVLGESSLGGAGGALSGGGG